MNEDIDVNLSLLRDSLDYKGDFKRFSFDNKDYFFAKDHEKVGNKKGGIFYGYFSYIKSKESNKAVRFIYTVTCGKSGKKCNINVKQEEKKAEMLMKSIEFKS